MFNRSWCLRTDCNPIGSSAVIAAAAAADRSLHTRIGSWPVASGNRTNLARIVIRRASAPVAEMDQVYLAQHLLEQRQFQPCIDMCTTILSNNALDQAAWLLKVRATTERDYVDDMDLDEPGVAEILLDENALSSVPRPGTSLGNPLAGPFQNGGLRPMTAVNRPVTGFARPGTSSRQSSSSASASAAFQGGRPGTSRPVSVAGRLLRLGTQSMMASGNDGKFIEPSQIDIQKFTKRPALAKALCDYLFYVEHDPKKALELAQASSTVKGTSKDWWWIARIGKAYYQLGMIREAQQQFKHALEIQAMVPTYLELANVFLRLDQPNNAVDLFSQGTEWMPGEISFRLGTARIYEALHRTSESGDIYKKILFWDSSNVESIASMASEHFYSDQPEIALRLYRRLLQMGVSSTELWNNIGLCCFYSAQYDMTLVCFEKALEMADDDNMADVWYNIGQVFIGIGDMNLAIYAFRVCVSIDGNHAEALNNLGVLELRKGNTQQAFSYFETATDIASFSFEPMFNAGILAESMGDLQKSWSMVHRSLEVHPGHMDSIELRDRLMQVFVLS